MARRPRRPAGLHLLQPLGSAAPVIAASDLRSHFNFDGRRRRPENKGTSGAHRRGPRAAAQARPIGRSASDLHQVSPSGHGELETGSLVIHMAWRLHFLLFHPNRMDCGRGRVTTVLMLCLVCLARYQTKEGSA
jgi:hypothetical protein